MKEINCRISTVQIKDENTLFINVDSNQNFGKVDAQELKKAALKLGNGKSFYNLINIGANTVTSKEAREIVTSLEGSFYKKADAIIINSISKKLLANLFLSFQKPVVPTKVFTKIEDAEEWLGQLQNQELMIGNN
ncbi:hypothetical protein K6119_03870 [Paracrocinitomix mangrovi]|uniref:DUF7793 family protein n=1 Tax=Paracrocinitomix mangrovi TaxID=2862509 RepID=UPI001C8E68A8|nr:hypothetical protein [Paracrocinitomix mangrovi]UKN02649.1 hypothetical protein K6119_03870 [Paracrocinitomix mangrovi]